MMITPKIYSITNKLEQYIENECNESYHSHKCWVTCIGSLKSSNVNNLQDMCINRLCNLTDCEELKFYGYPEEICNKLELSQCFFSSDSYRNFILWKKRKSIFTSHIIQSNIWIFSYLKYKNMIILGLEKGIIQIRNVNNLNEILCTLDSNKDSNVHNLYIYKNLLISKSCKILVWRIHDIITQGYDINFDNSDLVLELDSKDTHMSDIIIFNNELISFDSDFNIDIYNLDSYQKIKCLNYRGLILPQPYFTEYVLSSIIYSDNIVLLANKKLVFLDKFTKKINQVILFDFNIWQISSYYNVLLVTTSLPDIIIIRKNKDNNNYFHDSTINIKLGEYNERYNKCSAQLLVLNDKLIVSIGGNMYVIDILNLKFLT